MLNYRHFDIRGVIYIPEDLHCGGWIKHRGIEVASVRKGNRDADTAACVKPVRGGRPLLCGAGACRYGSKRFRAGQ